MRNVWAHLAKRLSLLTPFEEGVAEEGYWFDRAATWNAIWTLSLLSLQQKGIWVTMSKQDSAENAHTTYSVDQSISVWISFHIGIVVHVHTTYHHWASGWVQVHDLKTTQQETKGQHTAPRILFHAHALPNKHCYARETIHRHRQRQNIDHTKSTGSYVQVCLNNSDTDNSHSAVTWTLFGRKKCARWLKCVSKARIPLQLGHFGHSRPGRVVETHLQGSVHQCWIYWLQMYR